MSLPDASLIPVMANAKVPMRSSNVVKRLSKELFVVFDVRQTILENFQKYMGIIIFPMPSTLLKALCGKKEE